jgi:UDP-N-acetylmuramoyl-tripeptide--D-alanyl-D-alanine ligase
MKTPLWTADALLSATSGLAYGSIPPVHGVSIDTRTLEPGDIFVALQGEARDGHDFVRTAFEKGAAAALVQKDYTGTLKHLGPMVGVDDVLKALIALGRAARSRLSDRAQLIAVTGSVGKTGTKEALRHILSHQGKCHASVASYNNHFGVPLTLARMPEDTRYGVFEVGMNHPGEIIPLSDMIQPHIALITTVEAVHLEHFSTIEDIVMAKSEIFTGLQPNGTAILNRDNAYFSLLKDQANKESVGHIVSFGSHLSSDIRLKSVIHEAHGSHVSATIFGRDVNYTLGVPGQHIVMNSLGVMAAVYTLGADIEAAARGLAEISAPTGRGAKSVYGKAGQIITVLDESYNANPASMRAALSVLALTPPGTNGRRIAVLGDMLELGPQSGDFHAGLASVIESMDIDLVFVCGQHMENLWQRIPEIRRGAYSGTSKDLVQHVLDSVRPGDVIMIKGSLGSRMGLIVSELSSFLNKENSVA